MGGPARPSRSCGATRPQVPLAHLLIARRDAVESTRAVPIPALVRDAGRQPQPTLRVVGRDVPAAPTTALPSRHLPWLPLRVMPPADSDARRTGEDAS